MLKQEQISKNAAKYFKTAQVYDFMNNDLMEFLGSEFIEAPLSTHTHFNNAFKGGLIDHLLRVTKYAISSNESLPDNIRVEKSKLIKVCLLHQIGKAHLFTPCTSDWHIKNTGKMYDFKSDTISMRVSERSILYLNKFNIYLSDNEFQAIMNFDKVGDAQADYHTEILGELLKIGNYLATIDEKNKITNAVILEK